MTRSTLTPREIARIRHRARAADQVHMALLALRYGVHWGKAIDLLVKAQANLDVATLALDKPSGVAVDWCRWAKDSRDRARRFRADDNGACSCGCDGDDGRCAAQESG
jgi:hypothetical protein